MGLSELTEPKADGQPYARPMVPVQIDPRTEQSLLETGHRKTRGRIGDDLKHSPNHKLTLFGQIGSLLKSSGMRCSTRAANLNTTPVR